MMETKTNKKILAGCLLACIAGLIFLGIRINKHTSTEYATRMVYSEIEQLSQKQNNLKSILQDSLSTSFDLAKQQANNTIIHIYKNKVLTNWNSNIIDSKQFCGQTFNDSIIESSNGIYLVSAFGDSVNGCVLLNLLFRKPVINNDYLFKEFVPAKLYGEYDFELTDNEINVYPLRKASKNDSIVVLALVLLALGFALSLINSFLTKQSNRWFITFALMVVSGGVSLVLLQYLHQHLVIFASDIFSNSVFDRGFNLSLGTLFEFQICCLVLIINLIKLLETQKFRLSQKVLAFLSPIAFFVVYSCIIVALKYATGTNNLNRGFDNLADLNIYSYLFFLLICLSAISSLLLCSIIVKLFTNDDSKLTFATIVAGIVAIVLALISQLYVSCAIGFVVWLMMSLFFNGTLRREIVLMVVIMLTSVLLTYRFRMVEYSRRHAEMTEVAGAVAYKHNYSFENQFKSIERNIVSDSLINEWIAGESPDDDSITDYIKTVYFDKNIERFETVATLCKPSQELILEPEEVIVNCVDHFNSLVENSFHEKVSEHLTLIDLPSPGNYYLADFRIGDSLNSTHLYIEFFENKLWESLNMPSILLDKNDYLSHQLQKYSFAVYHDNVLVYKHGLFLYPNFRTDMKDGGFFGGRHFLHFGLNKGDYKSVVVTYKKESLLYTIAPFSYFCLVLFIISMIVTSAFRNGKKDNMHNSFRFKLQAVVLSTLFIILMAIGPISVIFIRNGLENTANEYRFLNTRSVMTSLQNNLHPNLNATDNNALLEMYSNTFSTDINLYDTLGVLEATSRHYLFNSKLVAGQMDAIAYDNIHKQKKLYYFQRENIGRAAFRTAYIPLRDDNGNAFAYLSLPDYTTDATLNSETTSFIFSYINIVLLLVSLSGIVVLLLSRRITKPLRLIQQRMKEVRIDKPNQPIEWKSKDEIGQLVKQYNLTLAELEKSANMLARSERETAWRDMARQVAHEIKNPLTPMRLSIQFLQQSWRENDSKLEQRFNDTTALLIEQIDSLSAIASAFSDYAKLPHNTLEEFNLCEVVQNTASLYNNNSNICFVFGFDSNKYYPIISDRNNLGRAVGNIVKNAVQAIGNKPDGKIEIAIEEKENEYRITVSDNGCGIEEEKKKNIFLPNFTTKSSGMGVGLSITRNIIESLKGNISFESQVNVGTTFEIIIPKQQ